MRSHRIRTAAIATTAAVVTGIVVTPGQAIATQTAQTEYTVLAQTQVTTANAISAITAAGGTVVERNEDIGLFRVTAPPTGFITRVGATSSLIGAAHRAPIGHAPADKPKFVERDLAAAKATSAQATHNPAATRQAPSPTSDPLDSMLWGQKMINADQAHKISKGSNKVTVGILDTGLDASHPDLAPNFNWELSRNFAKDIPDVDGPCEVASCLDPVGTDDDGHGTHVAGSIGASLNGFGVSGVAPGVSLVELKGGQDSGYFFLEPVVNALTHAGKSGIDVVNMSFYVDPWLYNCESNPKDSPEAQAEQRTIITAMNRALTFAHSKGVTLVGALGNENTDLGKVTTDPTSPDYPAGTAYERPVDNKTCLSLPTEGPFVIGVSSLGPSKKKADYSNYGVEQITVAAPGGWFRDGFGTPTYRAYSNLILSTYPKQKLQNEGLVDANGDITEDGTGLAFKECTADGRCGYFTYLQGTSMAAPHVTGVAALIVSRFGYGDAGPRGLGLNPDKVEAILTHTAAKHSCPIPALQTYANEGRSEEYNALCDGNTQFNGFYGHGIVDAYRVLTMKF